MSMLLTEVKDGVATLTVNRPDVRNALNLELVAELTQALNELSRRDDIRALVITGAGGKAFISGADIAEMRERQSRDAFFAYNATLFQKIEDFPRPTIAAIDGFALGGGLEVALACDLRVASKASRVGLPEVTLGIYPAAGGTWRLPRIVGMGRAKELVFTGRILDAEEAYGFGLFERLVEPGQALATAQELAAVIAKNAPLAVQVAKVSLNAIANGAEPASVEKLGQALLFDSQDKLDRMGAFLERKKKKEERK